MAHPTINIAINAAHIAGDLMRQELHKVATIPITRKARHDYVSEIDKESEAQIVREIKRYHPDHAFLGEEGGEPPTYDAPITFDGTWYLSNSVAYASKIALNYDGAKAQN